MDTKELRRRYWNEILTGALVLGGAIVLLLFLDQALGLHGKPGLGFVMTLLQLAVIVWIIYHYTKRGADVYTSAGQPYSFAKGFLGALNMSVFSGVVVGLGLYVVMNYISPGNYGAMVSAMAQAYLDNPALTPEARLAYQEIVTDPSILTGNLTLLLFGAIMAMGLVGGFIGLVTGALLKRDTPPAAE